MNNKKNPLLILFIIVLAAFGCRVALIWIGRPEFVGWFNHTYYYYVQTKGLLIKGQLPFPDMPLLFYESAHLQLFKVDQLPKAWIFDHKGYWYSYGH